MSNDVAKEDAGYDLKSATEIGYCEFSGPKRALWCVLVIH